MYALSLIPSVVAGIFTIGLKIAPTESLTVITTAVAILAIVIKVRAPATASVSTSLVKSVTIAPLLFSTFPAVIPAVIPTVTAPTPTLRLDGG
jgi:hypothetical protein